MSIEEISEGAERQLTVREIFERGRTRIRQLGRWAAEGAAAEAYNIPDNITASCIFNYTNSMLHEQWLDANEVNDVRLFWEKLDYHYELWRKEQDIPVANIWTAADAMKWEASGLTTLDNTTRHLGVIPMDTLRDSFESGAIRALASKDSDEQLISSFARFIEGYSGKQLVVGDYDNEPLDNSIIEMKRQHVLLKQMIEEASDCDYAGRYGGGPYKSLYAPIIDTIRQELNDIDPRLDIDALHTPDYQDLETRVLMHRLPAASGYTIEMLARYRYQASVEVAESTWKSDRRQIIPVGLLDRPASSGRDDVRACASAVFRMIYQGITGHFVGEKELRLWLQQKHRHAFVIDEEYLKLFETDTFKNEYGAKVQSLQFMGMNFDGIRTIAERKKAQHDDIKMFVVANLSSESYRDGYSSISTRIQHRVIVYGCDEKSVYVLDPNYPDRQIMDKDAFCARWAVTQNSGYLVVAKTQ